MIRYAISDRRLFPGSEAARQQQVVAQAAILAREGIDYFQLREKDLDGDTLFALTCAVRDAVVATGGPMQLVLNGPRHLSERAGVGWHRTAVNGETELAMQPCTSCSVHTPDQVEQHRTHASLLLLAPVFGKTIRGAAVQSGAGLTQLREAVGRAHGTPVLALGGITPQNAELCIKVGAAGVAGIRLFLR